MIIIILLITIIVIIVLLCVTTRKNKREGFGWDLLDVGDNAVDCHAETTPAGCLRYSDCGLMLKDNKMKCVPGDVHGPYFVDDANGWIYKNFYDEYIFGNETINRNAVYYPWNKFYSRDYEAVYPSPTSRATL
jgi:hypothetical protein